MLLLIDLLNWTLFVIYVTNELSKDDALNIIFPGQIGPIFLRQVALLV